jgi:bleomycin hydrolase
MKSFLLLFSLASGSMSLFAQVAPMGNNGAAQLTAVSVNPHTPVRNQGQTGTCWSFSTTALLESQGMKNKLDSVDLSEMFTVRNIYVEKAKNYLMRQGSAQFGEGSLGHDVIRSVAAYGAMPEQAYSGLRSGQAGHNHSDLVKALKGYLDSLLTAKPLPSYWQTRYNQILDQYLGPLPDAFTYQDKIYTAKSFSKEVMRFNADDYVSITSFTHKPLYQSFILDVPDNFSNGAYYNIPLEEMMQVVKDAIKSGYTIMWDADVSNNGFGQNNGYALLLPQGKKYDSFDASTAEEKWDATKRQDLFENLTTQDDHLMQVIGSAQSKNGKSFFTVKNSWGPAGPFQGLIQVSEAYFAINTISIIVPKAALSNTLMDKLQLK